MLISLIIPSRTKKDSLAGLLQDIADQQAPFETEIIRVAGVSPVSKARNNGAKMAKGQILVFIDSDIRLGDKQFLANLVAPLLRASGIGMSSASIRIPALASGFQIRYARQIPHAESPVVDTVTEVSVAASACCAIRPDLFFSLGGFEERIARGEDSLLSLRVKKAGQRVVLAPHTRCFHPQPDNLIELMRIQFRNGKGAASVDILHPDLNVDVDPRGIIYEAKHKTRQERILRFFKSLYHAILEKKMLLVLAKFYYLLGYSYGILRYKIYVYLKDDKAV